MKNVLIILVLVLSIATISQAAVILSEPTTFDGTSATKVDVLPVNNWDGEFWSTTATEFSVTWELDIQTAAGFAPAKKAAIMMFGPTGTDNTHVSGNKILMMQPDGTLTIAGADIPLTPVSLTTYKTAAAVNDGATHAIEVIYDIKDGLDICTIFIDGQNSLEIATHDLNLAVADNMIASMDAPGMVLGYNEKGSNAAAWAEFEGTLSNVEVTYVPEPATLLLLGASSLGLIRKRR
ncbi:MAG: PEP-CTERM sorting domain-containing protein [Phycisphaerae bacterium]|nr:PEP-CTERM sorting domain-containing protein [Phycisphaerae bacterium]